MPKTKAFFDVDGTITWLSGDLFKKEYVDKDSASKWDAKSIPDRLLEKLAAGEMDDLLLPGVIGTIVKLQTAGVEVYINSNNYEEFISALLLRSGLKTEQLSKIKIFGCKLNNNLSDGGNRDIDKVERIKRESGKELGDRNFVFDDSGVVVSGGQALQYHIPIEVITAEAGKFNWHDGSYYERVTTSVVQVKKVEKEKKEEEREEDEAGVMSLFSRDSDPLPLIQLSRNRQSGQGIEQASGIDNPGSMLYPYFINKADPS